MTNFQELVKSRHSVRKYETDVEMSDADLQNIFSMVTAGPSSFNVQHWQFVVVRDPARKQELVGLSFGQAQVGDCSAVVLVCGRLDAHEDADRLYADSPAEMREKYVPMINGVYQDAAELQREEAIRSGAMAAMSLMYAAKSIGWDSGPMIGFDATKVAEYLSLGEQTIPVMMIVIGKARNGEQPERAYRRPISEVVKLESMSGASLTDPGA